MTSKLTYQPFPNYRHLSMHPRTAWCFLYTVVLPGGLYSAGCGGRCAGRRRGRAGRGARGARAGAAVPRATERQHRAAPRLHLTTTTPTRPLLRLLTSPHANKLISTTTPTITNKETRYSSGVRHRISPKSHNKETNVDPSQRRSRNPIKLLVESGWTGGSLRPECGDRSRGHAGAPAVKDQVTGRVCAGATHT